MLIPEGLVPRWHSEVAKILFRHDWWPTGRKVSISFFSGQVQLEICLKKTARKLTVRAEDVIHWAADRVFADQAGGSEGIQNRCRVTLIEPGFRRRHEDTRSPGSVEKRFNQRSHTFGFLKLAIMSREVIGFHNFGA